MNISSGDQTTIYLFCNKQEKNKILKEVDKDLEYYISINKEFKQLTCNVDQPISNRTIKIATSIFPNVVHLIRTNKQNALTLLAHLTDQPCRILSAMKKCYTSLFDGKVPDISFFSHIPCSSSRTSQNDHKELNVSVIFMKSTACTVNLNDGKHRFKQVKTTAFGVARHSQFSIKLAGALNKHLLMINERLMISALFCKSNIKHINDFLLHYNITQVIDVFAGCGLFQAALKSTNPQIKTTSLDSCNAYKKLQGISTSRYSFFSSDPKGVIKVTDSAAYLFEHLDEIKAESMLLLSYPGPQKECLTALQQMLMLWGAQPHSGPVLLITECTDNKLLFGNLFTSEIFRKENIHYPFPIEIEQEIRVLPQAFYCRFSHYS